MMKSLVKKAPNKNALAHERQLFERSLARLEIQEEAPRSAPRIIFGLDLTASREWSLDQARIATADMFAVIRDLGGVALKLVYFRGTDECRESPWYDDPAILSRSMQRLECESGLTQISRILKCALRESSQLSAVVFIGDQCEEIPGKLEALAAELGRRKVPLFVFHECVDHGRSSQDAKPLFKRMAQLSGGAYVGFRRTSDQVLRELLANIAAYTASGSEGIERIALPTTDEARELRHHLLLVSGR